METGMATKAPWCAVTATVEVIGGRWKPTILFHLKDQPRRFNELRRLVPGITQRMLTLQLRALEQDGVVARTVHNSVPPHVEYSFTRKGLTLGPILDAMEAWAKPTAKAAAAPDAAVTLLIQSGGGPRGAHG
jgi:DNA-binding HxlR family transcriptional regulator